MITTNIRRTAPPRCQGQPPFLCYIPNDANEPGPSDSVATSGVATVMQISWVESPCSLGAICGWVGGGGGGGGGGAPSHQGHLNSTGISKSIPNQFQINSKWIGIKGNAPLPDRVQVAMFDCCNRVNGCHVTLLSVEHGNWAVKHRLSIPRASPEHPPSIARASPKPPDGR